jgi:hypothetical protein
VKKAIFYLLLVFTALAPSVVPAVAHADKKSTQPKSQYDSTKSRKSYLKHQKNQKKKTQKQQKQSLKNYKKLHNTTP